MSHEASGQTPDIEALAALYWAPIEQAPHDGSMVLVNDTTPDWTPWVAASFHEGDEWSGWVYDDGALADANPLGPQPTHYLVVPLLPTPDAPAQDANGARLERAARAMAERAGWLQWNSATTVADTPNGNSPDEERAYWRDMARTALFALSS